MAETQGPVLNNTTICCDSKNKRRGQPERLSQLQREIIAFYSRNGGRVQNYRELYTPTRDVLHHDSKLDPFVEATYWNRQSFYRSRQNLCRKGYLRECLINEPYEREPNRGDYGHELTEKAIDEFMDGDPSKELPPGTWTEEQVSALKSCHGLESINRQHLTALKSDYVGMSDNTLRKAEAIVGWGDQDLIDMMNVRRGVDRTYRQLEFRKIQWLMDVWKQQDANDDNREEIAANALQKRAEEVAARRAAREAEADADG